MVLVVLKALLLKNSSNLHSLNLSHLPQQREVFPEPLFNKKSISSLKRRDALRKKGEDNNKLLNFKEDRFNSN